MSFLTEVSTNGPLEFSPHSVSVTTTTAASGGCSEQFDYHLPHTKTIDLIGEEFAPRKETGSESETSPAPISSNVQSIAIATLSAAQGTGTQPGTTSNGPVFLNGGNVIATSTSSAILQAISSGQVLAALSPHEVEGGTLSATSGHPQPTTVPTQPPQQQVLTFPFNPNAGPIDLHHSGSIPIQHAGTTTTEENGVLLCNLDELSRYIPENFYTDFNMGAEPKLDYLDSKPNSTSCPQGATVLQHAPIMVSAPGVSSPQVLSTSSASVSALPSNFSNCSPITIQLPTQPQPPGSVKTVTYVQNVSKPQVTSVMTSGISSVAGSGGLQPVKFTTTGFAYTSTGERIAIQGLADPAGKNPAVQFQVKPTSQTLQLAGLDPSKFTVLQELPEVSKVVIQQPQQQAQDASKVNDSLSQMLEEMKNGVVSTHPQQQTSAHLNGSGEDGSLEYATAIPVAVTSLSSSKKSAAVLMPSKRSTRNIIFAGNTLPQGAIPIQINGLNALPISAVKSLPINLGNFTHAQAPIFTSNSATPTQVVAARKTKLEIVKSTTPTSPSLVSSLTNKVNNNTLKCSVPSSGAVGGGRSLTSGSFSKTVGNNKTCSWVFENGEICGKTFSKSYNLVVHMRMHEDVRPFCCSLCDQTFRQKAHLQRHETTHGIGVKVSRAGSASKKRKKKLPVAQIVLPPNAGVQAGSPTLAKRLARVEEKFGGVSKLGTLLEPEKKYSDIDEAIKAAVEGSESFIKQEADDIHDDESPASKMRRLSVKVERMPGDGFSEVLKESGLIEQQQQQHTSSNSTNNSSQILSVRGPTSGGVPGQVTAQFLSHPGTTTIVIDNLEEHSPEIQKEILNALLADQNSGNGLFTITHSNSGNGVDLSKTGEGVLGVTDESPYGSMSVQHFLNEGGNHSDLVSTEQPGD